MAKDPCEATITKRLAWLVEQLVVTSYEFTFIMFGLEEAAEGVLGLTWFWVGVKLQLWKMQMGGGTYW